MSKKKWRKVEGPKLWRPAPGDELMGFFGGTQTAQGQHGEYETVVVYSNDGAFSVSGCKALSLIRCAGALGREDRLRFVYRGAVDLDNGNTMKDYELYVLR